MMSLQSPLGPLCSLCTGVKEDVLADLCNACQDYARWQSAHTDRGGSWLNKSSEPD